MPDDRRIYSRYQELGAVAQAVLALEPEEALFFKVSDEGRVDAHGHPAVLIVKETPVPFLERSGAVYERVPDGGSETRIFWFTPAELERPSTAEFVAGVRAVGEPIVAPPPDEPGASGPDCASCGLMP